ncbi:hypothetical protein AVEN_112550-1 [Araneus ventricosus]|uniref:Uncharacterized protein n=1 Tax=Araneus ventricosus TaxID=182803 RepID=A0A4Y2K698_ARAVE|nr:hypothetical protein AVEN_112550-1 [Araneus ventricosus]
MPKKEKRPPAQSYTSYESCDLCERKEVPGMQKKTLDADDDSCIICEKKKAPRKGKKRLSPGSFIRGSAYSSKGYTEKQKKTPERSYASFDSCDLCEKKEAPRVATPKRIVESKSMKRSPTRETYAKETRPSRHSYDRRYGKTEIYEKRRKTSPREYRAPEGEKFRKWKEMEEKETCPLRMTGSISQRYPRNIRKEPKTRECYQRFNSPYACPVEMMDDDDDDDEEEEMLDDIPPCIENRINEIKKRMSETCVPCENGKVRESS